MLVLDREKLVDLLLENILTVTFEKVNGEERVMKCTLIRDYLPGDIDISKMKEELTPTVKKPHQSVWDIDAGGWRSFRWDKLKGYEIEKT